jgi:hypothetical protein
MDNRRAKTTLAILTLLATAGVVNARPGTNERSLNSSNANSLNQASSSTFCPPEPLPLPREDVRQQFTPVVDRDYIRRFITLRKGQSANDRKRLADFLTSQMYMNDNMRASMQLVFTHLPYLSIRMFERENFEAAIKGNSHATPKAAYVPEAQAVCLPDKFDDKKDFALMEYIRHEMRHAAMNAVQVTLSGKERSLNVNSYTPDQEANMEAFIKSGDQRVDSLKKSLQSERKGELSAKEQSRLDQLRRNADDDYQKYYQTSQTLNFPTHALEQIGQLLNKRFEPGATLDMNSKKFDFNAPNGLPLGKIRINKIEPGEGNNTKVSFTFLDPLHAAIHTITSQQDIVNKNYAKEYRLYERDAYLQGAIPQSLIKHLYPKLYSYTNNLIAQTRQTPVLHMEHQPLVHDTYRDMMIARIPMVLNTPHLFNALDAPYYVEWARYCRQNGQIEEAKTGLKTLIQRGHQNHRGEAHLELARLHMQEGDTKEAQKCFKIAEKRKANFSQEDRQQYISLLTSDQPKKAEKMRRKFGL